MRTVEYSNLFLDKLEVIQEYLLEEFGEKTAKKAIKKIFDTTDMFGINLQGEYLGKLFDIESDYYIFFVKPNYILYKIMDDKIIVADIYNEKEDFMLALFGISGITKESEDFWGE